MGARDAGHGRVAAEHRRRSGDRQRLAQQKEAPARVAGLVVGEDAAAAGVARVEEAGLDPQLSGAGHADRRRRGRPPQREAPRGAARGRGHPEQVHLDAEGVHVRRRQSARRKADVTVRRDEDGPGPRDCQDWVHVARKADALCRAAARRELESRVVRRLAAEAQALAETERVVDPFPHERLAQVHLHPAEQVHHISHRHGKLHHKIIGFRIRRRLRKFVLSVYDNDSLTDDISLINFLFFWH